MADILETTQAHNYSRGATILTMAAESYGLKPSAEQTEEWRLLIKAAFELDGTLDSQAPQHERETLCDAYTGHMLGGIEFVLPIDESFTILRQKVANWPDRKISRISSVIGNIKEIAAAKREATKAKTLGKLAVFEGAETARYLQLDGHNAGDFNGWLKALLEFGVVVDSSIDLPEDFVDGLTQVKPSRLNQAAILSYGATCVSKLAAATPLSLYRPLFAAARAVSDKS